MKGVFYTGAYTPVHPFAPSRIPLRIGEPFVADNIRDAREKAVGRITENGFRYGILCKVAKDDVTLLCTVRDDNKWIPCIACKNKSVFEDDSEFKGWKRI